MSSPELKILLKCNEQLAVLIRNNLETIAGFLHGKEIINREKYREAIDITSGKTDYERAKMVLHWLGDKVEEDTSHYWTFYDYLKSKKEYSKISAQMNEGECLFNNISDSIGVINQHSVPVLCNQYILICSWQLQGKSVKGMIKMLNCEFCAAFSIYNMIEVATSKVLAET